MGKLPMCRICLVEDVNMYIVVNKNLHELYEKLTDIPFVTKDHRPILACFFCCAKLKQCFRFLRKCLEAEELFAQMMNGDYEPKPSMSQDDLTCCTGFIKSPTVHVNIVDECETDSVVIKEEVPAICERQDDVIESNEEYQSNDVNLEILNNTCQVTEDISGISPHLYESDSGGDIKIEVEDEQEETKKKRRAVETNSMPAAKKPKLDVQKDKNEDSISPKHMKKGQEQTKNTENRPFKCDISQKSFSQNCDLKKHIRTHTGEKPFKCDICQKSFSKNSGLKRHIRTHTGEKPYKCDICQSSFSLKGTLVTHIRTHTGEKPYKCDNCQRSFSQKTSLVAHIRTHTGEKPYKCDTCQSSFSLKGHLVYHFRTHTGEKPYKCDICQKSYSRIRSLKIHFRAHTDEKPL